MKIEKWTKVSLIFDGLLDPLYKNTDNCEVYFVEGKGFAVLNRQPKYSLYQRLGISEIQDVFVLHEFRGQGIATSLINHCEKMTADDMIGISVPVSPDFGVAQQLYYKLGYRPDGNGVTYDREPLTHNSTVKIDENLCLMMVKDLE